MKYLSMRIKRSRDRAAEFRCHSAAGPVWCPKIPLPTDSVKSHQGLDIRMFLDSGAALFGCRDAFCPCGQGETGGSWGLSPRPIIRALAKPVGAREAVGDEAARFVALQDDTAAAGHQRDVIELDDQHFAVVADQGDGVAAFGLGADGGGSTPSRDQHLLAGAGLRQRLIAVDDKAAASLAATSSSMPGRWGNSATMSCSFGRSIIKRNGSPCPRPPGSRSIPSV